MKKNFSTGIYFYITGRKKEEKNYLNPVARCSGFACLTKENGLEHRRIDPMQ